MTRPSYLRTLAAGPVNTAVLLRPPRVPLWRSRIPGPAFTESGRLQPYTRPDLERPADCHRTEPRLIEHTVRATDVAVARQVKPASGSAVDTKQTRLSSPKPPVAAHNAATPRLPPPATLEEQEKTKKIEAASRPVVAEAANLEANREVNRDLNHDANGDQGREAQPARLSAITPQLPRAGAAQVRLLRPHSRNPESATSERSTREVPLRLEASGSRSSRRTAQAHIIQPLKPRVQPRGEPSETHKWTEPETGDRSERGFPPTTRLLPQVEGTKPANVHEPAQGTPANSIHIGSVDIHIAPPPAPAMRPPAPTQRAAAGVMSRGFVSTFGLNQG